jgi:hypothetical protein
VPSKKIALIAVLEALDLGRLASPTKPDSACILWLRHVEAIPSPASGSKHRSPSLNILFSDLHKHLDGVECRVGRDNKCKLFWCRSSSLLCLLLIILLVLTALSHALPFPLYRSLFYSGLIL